MAINRRGIAPSSKAKKEAKNSTLSPREMKVTNLYALTCMMIVLLSSCEAGGAVRTLQEVNSISERE